MPVDAARGNVLGLCESRIFLRANVTKTDAVGWDRMVNCQRHGSAYLQRRVPGLAGVRPPNERPLVHTCVCRRHQSSENTFTAINREALFSHSDDCPSLRD